MNKKEGLGEPHGSSKPLMIQIARTLWQIGKLVNWSPDSQFANLPILPPFRETVTDPPLGEDVLGLVGIFLYLLTKTPDVQLYVVRLIHVFRPPGWI